MDRIRLPLWLAGLLMYTVSSTAAVAPVDFLQDVRPILSSHCFTCHGPDETARKSGLRLDIRESALKPAKSGKTAIVPNKVEESELIRRVFTADSDDVMPPTKTKKPLTAQEKEILKRWIATGAEYKVHWAFVKPQRPVPPKPQDKAWSHNEIDNFILARLEKEKLKPSGPADKFTLVRRVYLDLIGLPPTPEQADAFVNDNAPDAYEKLVDRLLASPNYGERWARRWLDLARYADTNGYEKDRPRSMWPWRDWVINSLNTDMPFDQFTIEQLAGDLLPNATTNQIVATGFNRNTMINEEGGIDPLEYRFNSMVDRVHVTATTWLGMTMACAQCHTHKYDPIQHTDYYRFLGLMNNADEPKLELSDPGVALKREEALKQIASLESTLIDRFPVELKAEWLVPASATFVAESGAEAEQMPDGSFRITDKTPESDVYTVKFESSLPRLTHLQLEAIPDDKLPGTGPGRNDNGNFAVSEIELEVQPRDGSTPAKAVKFSKAESDYAQDGFPVKNAIDGKKDTAWAAGGETKERVHRHAIFTLSEPLTLDKGAKLTVRLVHKAVNHHTLGRFRLSLGTEVADPAPLVERQRARRDAKFAKWLQKETPKIIAWQPLHPVEATSVSPTLTIQSDDTVFGSGDFSKSDTYTVKFNNLPAGTKAIRIEALPDLRLPNNGPGTVSYEGPEGDFWLSNLKASSAGKALSFTNASQSYAKDKNTADKALDDDLQSGWSIDGMQGKANSAVFQLTSTLTNGGDLQLEMTFEKYYAAGLGKFRVWATTEAKAQASPLSDEAYAVLLKHRDTNGVVTLNEFSEAASDRDILLNQFVQVAPEMSAQRQEIKDLRSKLPKTTTTLVMRERDPVHPRATHRHHRGEFLQAKEEVSPGTPSFLPQLSTNLPANRLGLAKWLVSPENPLTARVVMNRQWEAFFGRGLVRTMEDFGFQGEMPSHPELLDWLATEFMKRGWSQKQMHKLIVMSATYQQVSIETPALIEKDPLNILIAHGPRFRVDAEVVRDLALVVSGLYTDKQGGPSVYPPQPAGVSTEGTYGALDWKTSTGPDRYRRGLYTFAKRTAPYAMTATFDGPSGEACLARRDRSNTPLQALTLLNDSVFMECTQALGRMAVKASGGTDAKLNLLFRRCLTRPPSAKEQEKLTRFYETQLARLKEGKLKAEEILDSKDGEKLNETAAWASVARVLLNLDETITKG